MTKSILLFFLLFNLCSFAQDTTKPALIPLPTQIQWTGDVYDLKSYQGILADEELGKSALSLQKYLESKGLKIPIIQQVKNNRTYIRLELEKNSKTPEGYTLDVNSKGITIKGGSHAGLFYGVQTFRQLTSSTNKIYGCHVTDRPAFAWRGYMIDAGRNFMPMRLLKQQIDVMARYKMNIFHFHFTEDIAWRLESKLYPQLTSPETMLRNKGDFYTEADLKELITYCKDRHITLIPEIDMPGHSAAFKRAIKVDMQSDSGLAIVKNIIREFISTYDVPYLHIGADEVKITNKNFLPEVTRLIESLGKKVIGWEPGGNFSESTIRQLWMEGATKVSTNKNIKYIDSRHLYLNHMDPLESVVTIFNRQICNLPQGNPAALGGIICSWPDRRVNKPEDVFLQNPVYPSMLAFAERSWRGGGNSGWTASIGAPESEEAKAFFEFENRMMQHKTRYFASLPFPYVKQAGLHWKLYGPFLNEGDLTKTFAPENKGFDFKKESASLVASGGTLILRHWWTPAISGVLSTPQENTTWYATTEIWSDQEQMQNFWIGFNNISRSYASDSPKEGTWDNRLSQVWVNDLLVNPPNWRQAGLKGDLENPLIDEGYEYREPTKIKLKKGWNKVFIKLPVGSFKGIDWKNPEKWMFTFVSY